MPSFVHIVFGAFFKIASFGSCLSQFISTAVTSPSRGVPIPNSWFLYLAMYFYDPFPSHPPTNGGTDVTSEYVPIKVTVRLEFQKQIISFRAYAIMIPRIKSWPRILITSAGAATAAAAACRACASKRHGRFTRRAGSEKSFRDKRHSIRINHIMEAAFRKFAFNGPYGSG